MGRTKMVRATWLVEIDDGDYVFYSKDNRVNMMTMIGYYAEVKFINKSTTEAELFAVSSEIFESSK